MSPTPTERKLALIEAILAEAAQEGGYAISYWSEADGDAGYLFAPDGRALAIGDYQYDISHIRELSQGEAKRDLGQATGNIQTINDWTQEYGELPNDLGQIEPILKAWVANRATSEDVDQVRGAAPDMDNMFQGGPLKTNGEVKLSKDVFAWQVTASSEKGWHWAQAKVYEAGDTVRARIEKFSHTSFVNVDIALPGIEGTMPRAMRLKPPEYTITHEDPAPSVVAGLRHG